jgi:hypothetical protein
VVGRARTGCGKTYAFTLPIVERLLAEQRNGAGPSGGRGRLPCVIVMAPTRELAKQVGTLGKKLLLWLLCDALRLCLPNAQRCALHSSKGSAVDSRMGSSSDYTQVHENFEHIGKAANLAVSVAFFLEDLVSCMPMRLCDCSVGEPQHVAHLSHAARSWVSGFLPFSILQVLCVYGGAPYESQEGALRRGVDVVIGTPGRIKDLMNRGTLKLSEIRWGPCTHWSLAEKQSKNLRQLHGKLQLVGDSRTEIWERCVVYGPSFARLNRCQLCHCSVTSRWGALRR